MPTVICGNRTIHEVPLSTLHSLMLGDQFAHNEEALGDIDTICIDYQPRMSSEMSSKTAQIIVINKVSAG